MVLPSSDVLHQKWVCVLSCGYSIQHGHWGETATCSDHKTSTLLLNRYSLNIINFKSYYLISYHNCQVGRRLQCLQDQLLTLQEVHVGICQSSALRLSQQPVASLAPPLPTFPKVWLRVRSKASSQILPLRTVAGSNKTATCCLTTGYINIMSLFTFSESVMVW